MFNFLKKKKAMSKCNLFTMMKRRWGYNIELVSMNGNDLDVMGCASPLPQVGDLLHWIGKLGTHVAKFINVEPYYDPPDGFSAKLERIEGKEGKTTYEDYLKTHKELIDTWGANK